MLYAAKIDDRHLSEQTLLEMAAFYTPLALTVYVFYRICWLMTPPMVSAASCFIWAVAWV